MTVSSTARSAGPFSGNGVTTSFPFDFKVYKKTDLEVTRTTTATGVQSLLVLDSDYSVLLNADQEVDPGGSVEYAPSGSPMPTGYTLTVLSNLPAVQETSIANAGNFQPKVLEHAHDYQTILIQQLLEKWSRTIRVPAGDTASMLLPGAAARAGAAIVFDLFGNVGVSANIGAQASAAAQSALDAEASRDAIDNRIYPGTFAVAPALRPDGTAIQNGDEYFGTDGFTYVRVAGAWVNQTVAAAASAASAATALTGAQTAKSAAETAQALAEAARDLAAGSAKVFTTTAQGLTATTSGQQFLLRTADLYTFDVYWNNAGVATLLGQIQFASGAYWQQDEGTNVLGVLADSAGNAVGYWNDTGIYYYSAASAGYVLLTGYPAELELTDADALFAVQGTGERTLSVIDKKGRPHWIGLGDAFSNTMSASAKQAFVRESFGDTTYKNFLIDKGGSELADRVYIHKKLVADNADGTSFARFPEYTPITDSTGVLFFSQRHSSITGGEERQRQVCKPITIDKAAGTITAGATVVIDEPATWAAGAGGNAAGAIGVRLPSGAHAGRIVILYNRLVSDAFYTDAAYERALYVKTSDDNGAAWSASSKVIGSAQLYNVLTGGSGGIPGAVPARNGAVVGAGNCLIRIPSGTYTGRIVATIYDLSNAYMGAVYSDDEGVTWVRGTLVLCNQGGKLYNESSLTYCSDGSLVMLARCENNAAGVSTFPGSGRFVSVDGGATWTYTGHVSGTGFGSCPMGLVNASIGYATGYEKLLAAASEDTGYQIRAKNSLKLSYDKGVTWPGEVKFFHDKQGVGYNCLVRLSNGDYVYAYETFNGVGQINTADAIGMIYFNEAELMAQAALN